MEIKWKIKTYLFWGFSERLGNGVGSGLVTALRFTRALLKAKGQTSVDRLFTSRYQASLRYDGTYRLCLFMELSQGVDVNYMMPCMLPGHVSQGPFHSYGVRRHLVNRAKNDVLHKNKEKLFSICPANYPRKSGTWPFQTTLHPLDLSQWLPKG